MKIERLFAAGSQQDRYKIISIFLFQWSFIYFSEEWITAIEIINRHTTPHLQHQLSTTKMITNDNVNHTENEYPAMNEVFTRRPVREIKS
jgi:hypothetical protein